VDRSAEADPQYLSSLKEPMPELGGDFEQLLDTVFHDLTPLSLNPASPGFMGYVRAAGFSCSLADLIATPEPLYGWLVWRQRSINWKPTWCAGCARS
jgi:hypothetical protein